MANNNDNGKNKGEISPMGAAVAGAAAGALAGAAAVAMSDPKKRAAVKKKAQDLMEKGKDMVNKEEKTKEK